jgi:hypothetical protein
LILGQPLTIPRSRRTSERGIVAAGMMDGMTPKKMTDDADFSSDAGPF